MGSNAFGCQRKSPHEEHQEGLDPEREVKSPMDFGEFGDLAKYGCIIMDKVIAKWVSE